MKKIIAFTLSLIMALSLFACDTASEEDVLIYTGKIFEGEMTLKVDGDSVTLINSMTETDRGTTAKMEMALVGGKATVSDGKVTADFTGEITYELTLTFSGDNVEAYKAEMIEFFLKSVSSDSDKKLVQDMFAGKTVKFDKTSALSSFAEGFNYVKADVKGNTALFTEARYESGEKVTFDYYESGAIKTQTCYNPDGSVDSVNNFEDVKPSDPSKDEATGDKEENGGATNQRPTDTQKPSGNDDPDNKNDESSTEADPNHKVPSSSSSNKEDNVKDETDEDVNTDTDEEKNEMNTVIGGGNGIIINGGNGGTVVGGGTLNGGEGGGIDLSDGVLFYISGTFFGEYSGMEAILDLPVNKMPTFSIKANIKDGDVTVKQHIIVKGGELIYCNGILAIVNFDVPDIKYYMTIELEGTNINGYKNKLLSDLEGSGMSETDIQLYKDALNGIEISFGKESSIYQGIKLHAIKFKLDINSAKFKSERFDIEQHQNQNNANSGNTNIYDSLTNIGGTATKDPEANKNFDNETPEV